MSLSPVVSLLPFSKNLCKPFTRLAFTSSPTEQRMPFPLLAIYLLWEKQQEITAWTSVSSFCFGPLDPSLRRYQSALSCSQFLHLHLSLSLFLLPSVVILMLRYFDKWDESWLAVIIRSGQEKLRAVDDTLFHVLLSSTSYLSSRSWSVIHSAFSKLSHFP